MIFLRVLLILALFPAISANADHCNESVVQLGSNSESSRELPRKVVLEQLAELYSAALNGKAPMEAALSLMKELADRELRTVADVRQEVEHLLYSPSERRESAEEQREKRAEEQSRLYEGLEPYLARISREHRGIIEEQILRRGLVNPLSTGEVEFHFRGKQTFLIGDEEFWGINLGAEKEVSFGIGDDFAIGQVPVTQFMYFLAALGEEGVDPTPSHFREGEGTVVLHLGERTYQFRPNHPVESVILSESQAHAGRVSRIMKASYGLPTETQWEFANRAGSTLRYHFGDDVNVLSKYGWFTNNAGGQTHAVGELLPNGFHLYDTHGNVLEWTSSEVGPSRVIRGGSWFSHWDGARSCFRSCCTADSRGRGIGFRLERQAAGNSRPSHTFILGEPQAEAKPGSAAANAPPSFYQGLLNRLRTLRRPPK
jgi:hypothetical protein